MSRHFIPDNYQRAEKRGLCNQPPNEPMKPYRIWGLVKAGPRDKTDLFWVSFMQPIDYEEMCVKLREGFKSFDPVVINLLRSIEVQLMRKTEYQVIGAVVEYALKELD